VVAHSLLSPVVVNPDVVNVLQDEEFLYLVMEYLPGGDVMVSDKARWLVAVAAAAAVAS
jgi:hypothetical protein